MVCIYGGHDVLWAYAKQFNITKLKWVVSGGITCQVSIRNGVYNLEGKCDDDIVIIHDGIRPLVDATGLVGSFFVDVLLNKNMGCTVYALGRNEQKAKTRFSKWINNSSLVFISYDINKPCMFFQMEL